MLLFAFIFIPLIRSYRLFYYGHDDCIRDRFPLFAVKKTDDNHNLLVPIAGFIKRDAAIKLAILSTISSSVVGGYFLRQIFVENDVYGAYHREIFQKYLKSGINVLEIGYGDGVNNDYYPKNVNLIGLDPRVKTLENAKYNEKSISFAGVVEGIAESLPFPSSSFDAVVATLVFCSVQHPEKALMEVSRVLKPGGVFISFEHILANETQPSLRFQHNQLNGLQQLLADGCHLDRQTDELFLSNVASEGQEGALFSSLQHFQYLDFSSQWPISHQFVAVLRK